jgi:glycosyltransferase involved in cell wall biosynthesis
MRLPWLFTHVCDCRLYQYQQLCKYARLYLATTQIMYGEIMPPTTSTQPISIIIPAYNEATVITNCLTPFLDNDFLEHNQVIVVCNACTDNTAQLVRQLSDRLVCLETDIPSKINALNLGDEAALYYPRIYLDADVRISIAAVHAMAATLAQDTILVTSLEIDKDLSQCSWLVKAYYEIWLPLPYCKTSIIAGLYALSEKGRRRFDQFPTLISDDGFVSCLFTEAERHITPHFYAHSKAPKDLLSLIKITTRSRLGRYELKEKYPQLIRNEKKDYQGAFKDLITNYKLWFKAFIYLSVNLICRVRAKYQSIHKKTLWERDESTRN